MGARIGGGWRRGGVCRLLLGVGRTFWGFDWWCGCCVLGVVGRVVGKVGECGVGLKFGGWGGVEK